MSRTVNSPETAVIWLRRDLRLTDNPALHLACEGGKRLVFVYIHAPLEESPWEAGAASRWWLHHSLESLKKSLEALGQQLVIRVGPSLDTLVKLAAETGANHVLWNRLYEPQAIGRDKHIKSALREAGLVVESCNAALLFEPWEIRTDKGDPYRVFTPFWKRCLKDLPSLPPPVPVPEFPAAGPVLATAALESLDLLPGLSWAQGIAATWRPGESAAHELLEHLVEERVAGYGETRNRPDLEGTSRLSPYLHFGEISPRQIVAALGPASLAAGSAAGTEAYVRELGWREFAHHLLFHFPHIPEEPLDAKFARFKWDSRPETLAAWQQGRTGYPIVDAGMRELWHTGWMHNRVRMIAASFLIKNLQTDWRKGARWFWDTLVDADLANNTAGWQWTAGCGADAAPYYRIFNPMLQSERFDPDRSYIRRWVPELALLPERWIHRPWEAPREVLGRAGVVLGQTYPEPVVDFPLSRERALDAYAAIKGADVQG